jgi:hypothetical protein
MGDPPLHEFLVRTQRRGASQSAKHTQACSTSTQATASQPSQPRQATRQQRARRTPHRIHLTTALSPRQGPSSTTLPCIDHPPHQHCPSAPASHDSRNAPAATAPQCAEPRHVPPPRLDSTLHSLPPICPLPLPCRATDATGPTDLKHSDRTFCPESPVLLSSPSYA